MGEVLPNIISVIGPEHLKAESADLCTCQDKTGQWTAWRTANHQDAWVSRKLAPQGSGHFLTAL